MVTPPPSFTLTETRVPYATLYRSLCVVLLGLEGELQAAVQRNDVVVFVTELFRTDEAGHEDAHARGEVVADVSGTGQKLGIGIIRVRIDTVEDRKSTRLTSSH